MLKEKLMQWLTFFAPKIRKQGSSSNRFDFAATKVRSDWFEGSPRSRPRFTISSAALSKRSKFLIASFAYDHSLEKHMS